MEDHEEKQQEPQEQHVEVQKVEKPKVEISSHEEKTWAICTHLSPLLNIFVPFPGVAILGPLIIMLLKKEDMPRVADEAKEVLNFSISVTLYILVAMVSIIGLILIFPIGLAALILLIIGAVKTSNGEKYQYPLTIRFIK